MDADGAGGSGGLSPRARQLKEELLGEFSLTVDDVAGVLEVDRSTVYRYIQDGALAALKIGREYRLSEVDVKGFLQALIERERRRVAELRVKALVPAAPPSPPALPRLTEPGARSPGEWGELASGVRYQAQLEAKTTGHRTMQPAHLLLAMLSDQEYMRWSGPFPEKGLLRDGLARQLLELHGVDVPALRSAAAGLLPAPDETPGAGDASRDLSPELRQVFTRAQEAMADLSRRWVGTDCLLLGLYGQGDVADTLRAAGAGEEAVRADVQRAAAVLANQATEGVQYGELARHVTRAAANQAGQRGGRQIEPDDLLLALLSDDPAVRDGLARRALDAVGADLAAIRKAARARLGPDREPIEGDGYRTPGPELLTVMERAIAAAKGLGHGAVGTEHLLLGLYSVSEVADLLEAHGASHPAVRVTVRRLAPAGSARPTEAKPMFGRYGERAQKTIMQAQVESRRRGTGYVASEHVLLALLSDEDAMKLGIARKALDSLRVDVAALREKVESLLPPPQHPGGGPKGEIQFTPAAKALVMEHAPGASAAMGHTYVGTEHLLLAAYDASPTLNTLLEECGAVREGVEAEILRLMGGGAGHPDLPLRQGAKALVDAAVAEAKRLGHAALQPGHFLLALTSDHPEVRGGDARAVLDRLNTDLATLRSAAEATLPKARRARAGQVEPNHTVHTLIAKHAVDAARAHGAARVGSQHLLLGLFATPEVAQLLAEVGAAEDAVRVEMGRLSGEQ